MYGMLVRTPRQFQAAILRESKVAWAGSKAHAVQPILSHYFSIHGRIGNVERPRIMLCIGSLGGSLPSMRNLLS